MFLQKLLITAQQNGLIWFEVRAALIDLSD